MFKRKLATLTVFLNIAVLLNGCQYLPFGKTKPAPTVEETTVGETVPLINPLATEAEETTEESVEETAQEETQEETSAYKDYQSPYKMNINYNEEVFNVQMGDVKKDPYDMEYIPFTITNKLDAVCDVIFQQDYYKDGILVYQSFTPESRTGFKYQLPRISQSTDIYINKIAKVMDFDTINWTIIPLGIEENDFSSEYRLLNDSEYTAEYINENNTPQVRVNTDTSSFGDDASIYLLITQYDKDGQKIISTGIERNSKDNGERIYELENDTTTVKTQAFLTTKTVDGSDLQNTVIQKAKDKNQIIKPYTLAMLGNNLFDPAKEYLAPSGTYKVNFSDDSGCSGWLKSTITNLSENPVNVGFTIIDLDAPISKNTGSVIIGKLASNSTSMMVNASSVAPKSFQVQFPSSYDDVHAVQDADIILFDFDYENIPNYQYLLANKKEENIVTEDINLDESVEESSIEETAEINNEETINEENAESETSNIEEGSTHQETETFPVAETAVKETVEAAVPKPTKAH